MICRAIVNPWVDEASKAGSTSVRTWMTAFYAEKNDLLDPFYTDLRTAHRSFLIRVKALIVSRL